MAGIAGEIEFNILPRELNSLGTTVNRMDQLRSSSHGVDRKAARIAEHVEHATPLCIVLEKQPIVALIDEEACLLAFEPIDSETQTVLRCYILAGSAIEETIGRFHERQRGLAFIIDVGYPSLGNIHQGTCDIEAIQVHTNAMSLHDSRLAVAIDDESRQVVALTMNQTEGRVGIMADGYAHLQGRTKTLFPESIVDSYIRKREHTDGNGACLSMTNSDEIAVFRQHSDLFAFFNAIIGTLNGTREHPRMKTPKRLFLSTF